MLKKYGLIIGLALIVAVLFSWNVKTALAAGINLSDIDNHWARLEITEMYSSGILQGYPEGVFLPGNEVTRLEVVAMLLRVMGLENQAKNMENAVVDYAVPKVNWGRGYLLVGVQQGMLDKDYLVQLRPAEAASRAEVAVLLYHALKLEDTSSKLTFEDTDDIPLDYQSCVAAVVNRGIMQGMPGNVFKPNEAVNRGQMAAMLSRVLALNYGDSGILSKRFSGVCTYIGRADQSSWLITLNESIDRLTTPECEVFLDGRATTLSAIEVGHHISMVAGNDGLIVFVSSSTTGDDPNQVAITTTGTTYKGKFESIREISNSSWLTLAAADGATVTRQISTDMTVDDFGVDRPLSTLIRGDYLQISVNEDRVLSIKKIEADTIKGVVVSVRTNGFTVRQDSGSDYELGVSANVQVVKGGATTTYDDVRIDNRVQVAALEDKALRIDIIGTPSVQGIIKELTTTSPAVITIREDNGSSRDYVVLSDVEVYQKGSRLRLTDLREGDQVNLELNNNNRVIYIELVDSDNGVDKLTGEIWDIITTGTYRITIRNDERDYIDYIVDSEVEVRRNGAYISFNRLSIGDRVKMELNSRERVDYIEVVTGSTEIESGFIYDLALGSSPQLFLERSNGGTDRYYIRDDATFRSGNGSLRLKDLVIGSEVEVTLEDGDVKKIDVLDDRNIIVKGRVTNVNTNNNRITIRQLSGNEFVYDLTDSAVVRDEIGRSISLRDVREGWDVSLNLSGGRVSRVTQY